MKKAQKVEDTLLVEIVCKGFLPWQTPNRGYSHRYEWLTSSLPMIAQKLNKSTRLFLGNASTWVSCSITCTPKLKVRQYKQHLLILVPIILKSKLLCNLRQHLIPVVQIIGIKPGHEGLQKEQQRVSCVKGETHSVNAKQNKFQKNQQ